jgi:HK97 family phage major capsid protein
MTAEVQERIETLETFQKSIADTLEKVLKYVEDSPKLGKSGYVTQDGGRADANLKSFGDWLFAIKRGDHKRLHEVYGSAKALSEDVGVNGGYVVPPSMNSTIFQLVDQASALLARIDRVQVSTPAGDYPSLDYFTAPTAGSGQTPFAAGMTASNIAEGGSYSSTQPRFTMVNWRVGKIGNYVQASNELVADSPTAIENLLRDLITVTITSQLERHVLRGNGVNEPLGILNAPALVQVSPVTNNVFAYVDANTMLSRFLSVSGQGVWVMHPGTQVDLGNFEVGTGGSVYVANIAGGAPNQLLSYDVLKSRHLPQTNNSGHILLIDPKAYKLFVRQDIAIAYSEHAAFTSGQDTWRFDIRCDGQPIMKGAVTSEDPQGSYTMSPFVSFND